jgi:hypothetical protein
MLEDDSPEGVEAYGTRALNVIGLIDRSIEAGGRDVGDVRSWLAFGCGYGRVIRFLVQRVDPDRVYATDVIEEAVEFCELHGDSMRLLFFEPHGLDHHQDVFAYQRVG